MIDVRSLSKVFYVGKKKLCAIQDVSFQIAEGEMLGLVGESGCGKSTLAKMLVRLEKPTSGQIFLEGRDMAASMKDRSICQSLQMIFHQSRQFRNCLLILCPDQALILESLTLQVILSRPVHTAIRPKQKMSCSGYSPS